MSNNNFALPYLPSETIIPDTDDDFILRQYTNRTYEEIAYNINSRDFIFFTIPISSTAADIPNLSRFGAFVICVSGSEPIIINGLEEFTPTGVWALAKSSPNAVGVGLTPLISQAGVGATWGGIVLTVTTTATNYQIAHNLTGVTANFNIRIVGTQL